MYSNKDCHTCQIAAKEYVFYGCHPAVASDKTRIGFEVPEKTPINLAIYDMFGREMDYIINSELEAGYYEYNYNCSKYPEGVYIVKLKAGKFAATKKMFIIR